MEEPMAQPIIGKAEFKRTADGKVLLTIDPDSTWEILKMQYPDALSGTFMIMRTDDSITLFKDRVYLRNGELRLGDNGAGGSIFLHDSNGNSRISLDSFARIRVGNVGQAGSVQVRDASGKDMVVLNGQDGDIILQNGDCAEYFELAESEPPEPGSVMVLDDDGKLRQSEGAYDKKVAGVISGAGDYRPGIILGQNQTSTPKVALAMLGKVFCKVDAIPGPIGVGDLLTTSLRVGHAMRADDPERSFGTIIGKALRPWRDGLGLIPILVALQ
jgi:hypothetical protein